MGAHVRMLLGVVLGAAAGLLANAYGGQGRVAWVVEQIAAPIGQVFLRLLFMLVVPMLFSAIALGVSELELVRLRRVGLRTLGYTVVVSAIAVALGLLLVNAFRPGDGLPPEVMAQARAASANLPAPPAASGVSLLVNMVPDNPVKAAASGDMLGVIVFSVLFGVALSLTRGSARDGLRLILQGLYDVMLTLIGGVLKLAPVGVAALLFSMTARLGLDLLVQLLAYVGVALLAMAIHLFGVYSLSVWLLGKRSPLSFFKDVRLAMLTAFATSSSTATLPTALKVAEENLRLPAHVSRFVLTAGAAMNQNGTALFEGVTVLFLAQLFGVELSVAQQLLVMGVCILGGIGTAGVPAGSLPVVALILGMVGIPPEGLGLILGVDRILDMSRTVLNVTGDLAAATYVAQGEPDVAELPMPERA